MARTSASKKEQSAQQQPKAKSKFSVDRLREVAERSFLRDMTNIDIATELRHLFPQHYGPDFDRHKVEAMLVEARSRGVVRFVFPERIGETEELQDRLKEKFECLDEAIVLPFVAGEQYEALVKRFGEAAARYFERETREFDSDQGHIKVGVTGGQTINAFVNAVSEEMRYHVDIHTLAAVGTGQLIRPQAAGRRFTHINPIVNATALWLKCGGPPGHLQYVTVTPYESSLNRQDIQKHLDGALAQPDVARAIKQMSEVNLFFVGLGEIDSDADDRIHAQITMTQLLGEHLEAVKAEKACGDLGYTLFRADGKGSKDWRFFLTPEDRDEENKFVRGVDFYARMVDIDKHYSQVTITENGKRITKRRKNYKKVIVMAGRYKTRALKAALNASLLNVLITDETSARILAGVDSRGI